MSDPLAGVVSDAAPASSDSAFEQPGTLPPALDVVVIDPSLSDEVRSQFGECIRAVLTVISQHIDLSTLSGITIARDYRAALAALDQGIPGARPLQPSDGEVIGVAMTALVVRDGQLRSRIVLGAGFAEYLLDSAHEQFRFGLHLLAHECAHVEVNSRFEEAFPGLMMLRYDLKDHRESYRLQTAVACWDEYAATWIGAGMGEEATDRYEETFLRVLESTSASLALEAGVDRTFISMLERGVRQPTIATLFALCDVLGEKPEHLVTETRKFLRVGR